MLLTIVFHLGDSGITGVAGVLVFFILACLALALALRMPRYAEFQDNISERHGLPPARRTSSRR